MVASQVRVRDGLDAFVQRARDRALEQFRHEQAMYVAGGLKKKPKPPPILKRERG